MPLVYQQNINDSTKIAVWHITEEEAFFRAEVPLQRNISHWHKRLQHLAGRLLLKEMYPDFPVKLIQIADTKKPYLEHEAFHFSISHCGDYAAAIVSETHRVGVDVELLNDRIERISHKFMYPDQVDMLNAMMNMPATYALTLFWSIKESVFKWWGRGGVDFKDDIVINAIHGQPKQGYVHCIFNNEYVLRIDFLYINDNFLTWVITDH